MRHETCCSALPLAIFANAARVSTIVLIAEFWSTKFAAGLYHNWSGFVFFLLVGLTGLLLVSFIINGGLKKLFRKRSTTKRVMRSEATG